VILKPGRVIPVLVFLISFAFYFFLQRMHPLTGDEFNLLAGADRILNGQVPYRDFFQFITPGSMYLAALLFFIFGIKYYIITLATALIGSLIITLTYILSRRIIEKPLFALMPAAYCLLFSMPFFPIYSHHWLSTLFLLAAVNLAVSSFERNSLLMIFFSGLLAGLTFISLQHKGALLLLAILSTLIFSYFYYKENLIKPCLWLMAGFASIMIPFSLYLFFSGSLKNMLYDCFVWVYEGYLPFNSYPAYCYSSKRYISYFFREFGFPENLLKARNFLLIAYLPLFVIVHGGLTLLRTLYSNRGTDRGKTDRTFFLYYITSILLFVFAVLPRPDDSHILFVFQPIVILFSLCLQYIYLQPKQKNLRSLVISAIAAAIAVSFIANSLLGSLNKIKEASGYIFPVIAKRGVIFTNNTDEYAYYRDTLAYIEDEIKGENIFIYTWSTFFYFLPGKKNFTKYDGFIPGYNTNRQMDEVIEEIKKNNIGYILYDGYDRFIKEQGENSHYPLAGDLIDPENNLVKFIEKNYESVKTIKKMVIYRKIK